MRLIFLKQNLGFIRYFLLYRFSDTLFFVLNLSLLHSFFVNSMRKSKPSTLLFCCINSMRLIFLNRPSPAHNVIFLYPFILYKFNKIFFLFRTQTKPSPSVCCTILTCTFEQKRSILVFEPA